MTRQSKVKFTQIAIGSATDQDLSDRIYALGEDGNIYRLALDFRSNWNWLKLPELDENKMHRSELE